MKIVLTVIGVLVLIAAAGFLFAIAGLSAVRNTVINEVNLAKVPDGVYRGRFSKNRWTYEVEVTVKNQQISSIVPTNKISLDFQREVAEKAAAAIIAGQSVTIDVVSSATANTRAFQKAVENALSRGADQ
jgi:uncharacterized protein with FMN-binding domain